MMDRRFFMQALASFLGMFGLGQSLPAKEKSKFDVKKWCRWLRQCDEHTMNAFKDTVVIDECGEAHTVPVIWATDEKADFITTDFITAPHIGHTSNPQFEKLKNDPIMEALRDRTVKVEIPDILRLPLINIYRGDFNFTAPSICIFYTLTVRTLYQEDMNQILEQIISKFHPLYEYEVGTMQLLNAANNLHERNDRALTINKYQFTIKVTSLPLEKK